MKLKRFLALALTLAMLLSIIPAVHAENTYEKISEIAVGDTVLLVYEAENMGFAGISNTSTKYGLGVDLTTGADQLQPLTVAEGSSAGTYAFRLGEKYLTWKSGNSLDVADEITDKSSWTVTFDENGNAVITNVGDTTRVIYWNASSPRFACYAKSGQKAIALYKIAPATEPDVDPENCQHPNMVIDEKAPSCMESGYKYWNCPDCGESGEETYPIDPNGHLPGRTAYHVLQEPNCTYPGEAQSLVYCDLCGGEVSNVIEEIPVNGVHKYVDDCCVYCNAVSAAGTVLTLADSISDGDRVVFYSVAGECVISVNESGNRVAPATDFILDGDTLISGDNTAVLTAYDMGNGSFVFERSDIMVLVTDEDGNCLYYDNWGKACELWYLVPVDGQPGLFKIMNATAAYKGNYNQALEYHNGTFTTYGVDETEAFYFRIYVASSSDFPCDHELTLDAVLQEPTCSTPGLARYYCDLCGEEVLDEISTLPHTWDEGVLEPPTCYVIGTITYTCSVCGATRHDYINALGHDYQVTETPEATCTEDGCIIYTCANAGCGQSYKEITVPALGHDWTEASCTATPCCTRCNIPGGIYFLVEDANDLSDMDQLVIVANVDGVYKALDTTIASTMEAIDVTVVNGMVTGNNLPVWTARYAEGGFVLTAGQNYLRHNGNTSFSATPEVFAWTFENTENGMRIYNGNRAIVYKTGTINAFRAYAISNIGTSTYYGDLLVFKYEAGATLPHADENGDGRCDGCGTSLGDAPALPDAMFVSRSISLTGDIAVNYYMYLSEKVASDTSAYMQFVLENGKETVIYAKDLAPVNRYGYDLYMFTCEVSAKEMTDTICASFSYANGEESVEISAYSVKKYTDGILPSTSDGPLKDLIVAMLHYGAASQIQFNYKTDTPADEGLEPVDYSLIDLSGYELSLPQGTEKVSFAGASLLLESTTTLRLFFTVDASVADSFVISYDGTPLEVNQREVWHYVDLVGIAAQDLDELITVTVNDGTETAEVTYYPLAYCVSIATKPCETVTDALVNCVKALFLFNQAANLFF